MGPLSFWGLVALGGLSCAFNVRGAAWFARSWLFVWRDLICVVLLGSCGVAWFVRSYETYVTLLDSCNVTYQGGVTRLSLNRLPRGSFARQLVSWRSFGPTEASL